jgi:uncharacterized coiled-coil protein SlyX
VPSLDLLPRNLDQDLEYYLHCVNFVLPLFYSLVLIVIDYFTSLALVLSDERCEKWGAELAQMAKIMELEMVMQSQANKITELETTCIDLKHGKDKLTDGYRRLAEKHNLLEQDMANLVEANAS